MSFTVYILACSDGNFHSGVTKDLKNRLAYHNRGENIYTADRQPLNLAFEKSFVDIRTAIDYHKNLESWSIEDIKQLIAGKLEITAADFKNETNLEKANDQTSIVLPSTYLGNLNYYAEFQNRDEVIIDLNETFQKQTYRSRCSILTANGIQHLSVPVIRPNGKATTMAEVEISYAENWQKDHVKALESAYRKSPFYEFYAPDLFTIIEKKHKRLVDLNAELMRFIIGAIDWDISQRFSSSQEQSAVEFKILVTKHAKHERSPIPYPQVLNAPGGFAPNLSIIDLLFNCGKQSIKQYL